MILAADLLLPVRSEPLRGGAVRLEGEAIAEVGPVERLASARPGLPLRRWHGAAILPGLVSLHSHLEFAALGPLRSPRPFLEWLGDLVRRSRSMTEEGWRESARLGARLTLAAGITAAADITRTGAGTAAMAGAGLAGTSYLEWVAVGDDGLEEAWGRFLADLERLRNAAARGGGWPAVGISPHAPYTLSRGAMARAGALAAERSLPVATHVAETDAEVQLVGGGGGPMAPLFPSLFGLDFDRSPERSPLDYLAGLGLLGPRAILAHGVHLSPSDLRTLAASGAALALCPRSNAFLEAGTPPDPVELDRLGIPWGLGTDSLASVPSLDLLAEARALLAARPGVTAERALRAMTLDGARILGLEDRGALEPGRRADVVVVEAPRGAADAAAVLGGGGRVLEVFKGGTTRLGSIADVP